MSHRPKIYEMAVETFEITCFLFPVQEDGVDPSGQKFELSGRKTVVEFSGAAEGMVVISTSEALLNAMAANMLGIEEPNASDKEEALCEVANIISGNIAPMFSDEDEICYINPPQLIEEGKAIGNNLEQSEKESVRVFFNEGAVDIEAVYQS